LSRFDRKIKDPRSFGENKKIVKIVREFLKINCSIDKLEKTLKSFVKKNKLSDNVFKDLSTIKNLSKLTKDNSIAAFVMESGAQMAGGVIIYPKNFQKAIAKICKKISNEVI